MQWKLEVGKSENVVAVGGRVCLVDEKGAEVATGARECDGICREMMSPSHLRWLRRVR